MQKINVLHHNLSQQIQLCAKFVLWKSNQVKFEYCCYSKCIPKRNGLGLIWLGPKCWGQVLWGQNVGAKWFGAYMAGAKMLGPSVVGPKCWGQMSCSQRNTMLPRLVITRNLQGKFMARMCCDESGPGVSDNGILLNKSTVSSNRNSDNIFVSKIEDVNIITDASNNAIEINQHALQQPEGVCEKILPALTIGIKSRKRQCNSSAWRRNSERDKKQRGQPYISRRNEFVPGKILLPHCLLSCRKKCHTKFNAENREEIFQNYWKLGSHTEQLDFIHSNTDYNLKKRNVSTSSRRARSIFFYLPLFGKKIKVCKTMFINTLGIKKGVVDYAMKNRSKLNTSTGDKRGKHVKKCLPSEVKLSIRRHIESFPAVSSHYCRKDSNRKYLYSQLNINEMYRLYVIERSKGGLEVAKKSMYRVIFNNEYNLGFHRPRKDQCRRCMDFEKANDIAKAQQRERYEQHLREKNRIKKE